MLSFIPSDNFSAVKDLYISSFPANERRLLSSIDTLVNEDYFQLYLFEDHGDTIGFATLWLFKEFIYIEHFAITPHKQGLGIGSKFLAFAKEVYSKPIVLEVDTPDNDIAKRRIEFYKRNGFALLQDFYLQPSYSPEGKQVEMKIMIHNKQGKQIPFLNIKITLYQKVYNYQ